MKKILTLVIAIVMVLSMSVASFAKAADFLESPSKDLAPGLDKFEHEDPACTGDLNIISYGDKDKLPEEEKNLFEDAYDSIVNADDLSDINPELDGDNLAVGDLFAVDFNSCEDHDKHGKTTLDITSDSAKNFNSLIAFDGEKWVIVDATVSGDKISFSAKLSGFTVFAIVVNTASDAPQTGDTFSWIYVALMVASATGFIAVCVSMRKKKN